LCCICHVNLDAVWGRQSLTVASTLRGAVQMTQFWTKVGLTPNFPPLGPYLVGDLFGASVAIAMILKSLDPGCYVQHQQFESIRKLRVAFSNIYMTSLEGTACMWTFGVDRKTHLLTSSPTQSQIFECFEQGCISCMGQEVRQDWAITLMAMHALMATLEVDWSTA